ncbi:Demethylspheroidene O-methyltransferase [Roseibium aquae]|uniref:Demethylspheroidene O-methyltransferase n=1 Tax=Roseibium aquae TaxID=1323746 RepID=A0A916T964_9HYPH|nr:methyltransferase [Roseibium aquae]GGB33900.1 Demethylspheroidene O-methyltransferase [Roseibium aquae]
MSIPAEHSLPPALQPNRRSILDRVRIWRHRVLADPAFHRLLKRLPLGQWYSNRRAADLFSMVSGFVQSQMLFAALETGLLHRLQKSPAQPSALSAELHIPPRQMRAFLQCLDCLGLTSRLSSGELVLNDFGAVIASDPGVQAMIRHHALFYRDLADPVQLLKSGARETALNAFWSYLHADGKAVDESQAEVYSRVMSDSQHMLADDIARSFPFKRHHALLDIGGGAGVFIETLAEHHPHLTFGLFDLPEVVRQADQRFAGSPVANRVRLHGGNFFEDPIPPDYDCISLIRVLFDHDDGAVMRILSNIRKTIRPGTRLLIGEPMAGRSREQRISTAYFSIYLMTMGGGFCRTPHEIKQLLESAGFSKFQEKQCRHPMLATLAIAGV